MLEGTCVNLRIVEKEDLPQLAAWNNNPEFGGEFEPLEQLSLKETENWYNTLHAHEKWFIIEKKDGTRVGQIMHTLEGSCYTIGYTIVPSERGKGYCTEAVKIMVDYLFLSTTVVRIQSGVSPRNAASLRVLEKAGFTKEGVKRKVCYARGIWHDEVMYSILREEWKEPHLLNR
jgi:RimJ/RimL family protein N-acetyltransferase